jgi:hypothetical protein
LGIGDTSQARDDSFATKKGRPNQGGPLNLFGHLLRHQFIGAAASMGKTVRELPRMRIAMLMMKNTNKG